MEKYAYLFLLFLIYSVLGWIVEMCFTYIFQYKKFVNRGFLIGPYCPIYGCGVLLIIYLLKDFTSKPVALFVLAMAICMALEYITSYIMEKLFNARWWDYSDKKFNINGRICLETTIPFGIGGLLVMYVINPFINKILVSLPKNTLIIISLICFILFLIDLIISFNVIMKIKNIDISKYKGIFKRDDTEKINKRVREYLINHSILTKRLMLSFPNARIRIKNTIKNGKKKIVKKLKGK